MLNHKEIIDNLIANQQEHIVKHLEILTGEEQIKLLLDCKKINFLWLKDRVKELNQAISTAPTNLQPAEIITLEDTNQRSQRTQKMITLGENILSAGKVAAFLVAGGQGSRLGYQGPKGCYPIGPVTSRSLFQWHAEKILASSKKYKTTIPWYIMTSQENSQETQLFFKQHNYFGLSVKDIFFFPQAAVPSLNLSGKLILANKNNLAMNPDGHGGSLTALSKSGAIDDMKNRGIEYISYFQVDNPLVNICDPLFIGYHVEAQAEMSSKVLKKATPEEKIGTICLVDNKVSVIEYSDLDQRNMYLTNEKGELVYWAGSIAIHILTRDFIEKIPPKGLPWHRAKKKIPFYQDGKVFTPEKENGIKFETFIFDALPLTKKSIILEVAREEEFAPVKNLIGNDSVISCQKLISNKFARWLARSNIKVLENSKLEISPLYANSQEEFIIKTKDNIYIENSFLLS